MLNFMIRNLVNNFNIKYSNIMKEISEKTLIPISLVVMIVTLSVYASNSRTMGEVNAQEIAEVKEAQTRVTTRLVDRVVALEAIVYKIDGKIDILLQNKK